MDLFLFSNKKRLLVFFLVLIISSLLPLSAQAFDFKKYLSPAISSREDAVRKQGTADGAFWLAVHHLNKGGIKDSQSALGYFKAASSMGHSHAGAIVGFFFLDESFGDRDLVVAKKWILNSYRQGSEFGAYGVALLRSAGVEVKEAPGQLQVLKFAWESGLTEAGFAYAAELEKQKTKAEHIQAYEIYRNVCSSGEIDACLNAGVMTLTSLYVPINKSLGYGYLLYAADSGSEQARKMVTNYAPFLTPADRSSAVDIAVGLIKKRP